MDSFIVDFKIKCRLSGDIISYNVYDEKIESEITLFLDTIIDNNKSIRALINLIDFTGIIEIENLLYIYQIIDQDAYLDVLFSSKTMESLIFRNAIDKIEEGIHIYNSQGYAMYLNRASERLGGMNKKDFEGKHLLDLYHLDEGFSTVLTTLRQQSPVLNRCDVFRTYDDKTLTTINSAYPIYVEDKMYGAILMENDLVTLKKQAFKNLYLNDYLISSNENKKVSKYFKFNDIVHKSNIMKELIHISKKIALNNSAVLIYGETGTGKELLAQSIHSFGKQEDKPFVAVNCAAIPSNLAESLFFGTVKGAFTGSINSDGFFQQANGGTLFLDEVNSMSLDMQSKLLRVLQDKKYRKIGSQKELPLDVRIIAASNEDLNDLLKQKLIRSDFYYRISTIVLDLPSLSERIEDIKLLANHFIKNLNLKHSKNIKNITEEVLNILVNYNWPGNIRELENSLEYSFAMLADNCETLEVVHLPKYLSFMKGRYSLKGAVNLNNQLNEKVNVDMGTMSLNDNLNENMIRFEKELIIKYLENNSWNISKTAKKLDIKRQSLQYRINKYGLKKDKL